MHGKKPGEGVRWILDVDIRAFFDTLDHASLRQMLDQRIRDGVVRRMIGKWLSAGVMKEERLWYREEGTPQGGVISPLLSNLYLHEVLDHWFEQIIKPRLKGRAFLVRYADDFVMGFEREDDARRVHDVLPKRFARYGLELHPEKTRLVEFSPPEDGDRKEDHPPTEGPAGSRGSFDFLGFNHRWALSRKGKPTVQRATSSKRFTRALGKLRGWMEANRCLPLREQWRTLCSKLRGHYQYYGIRGNSRGITRFSYEARGEWFRWLNRRGGGKPLTWTTFTQWLREVIPWPPPRIRHA